MYAIVDIETTGGYANGNGITEIAIILHNGETVEGKYHTLINPGTRIPHYIISLTGITNEMVADAPPFEAVAENIYNLLSQRIFVAHNVNFDYSFVKHHLLQSGYQLNTRKLCTVRLARKILPGHASYSLGNLCRSLQIGIEGRHRAWGDAAATVTLFEQLLAQDTDGHMRSMLKGKNKEQYLPPNVPVQHIEQLPTSPGVYYFHDHAGKVIYVGKASNLQQRVSSHFSNNDGSRRKQELLRQVHRISHRICSSELMALIVESVEIRTLWPLFNRSQKRYHHAYGLYPYEDRRGYMRLGIEKKKQQLDALYTFNLLHEGQTLLRKMVEEFCLDASICFGHTAGTELPIEPPEVHNGKLQQAIEAFQSRLPTFAIMDGEDGNATCFLMEQGRFYGMGNIPVVKEAISLAELKQYLKAQPDNDYIRGLIYQYAGKFPERKIPLIRN